MSYDNRTANFAEFINLLKKKALTHQTKLICKSAHSKHFTPMQAKNTAVINANVTAKNARINRDNVLYDEETGVIALSTLVKKYVKSVLGTDAPQYRQLTALKFRQP